MSYANELEKSQGVIRWIVRALADLTVSGSSRMSIALRRFLDHALDVGCSGWKKLQ